MEEPLLSVPGIEKLGDVGAVFRDGNEEWIVDEALDAVVKGENGLLHRRVG